MRSHHEKVSHFVAPAGKIISVVLGALVFYAASYYLIKTIKPDFLVHNDTVSQTYRIFYKSIRRLDAARPAHLEGMGHPLKVMYDGCNHFGDKIFFKYNNKTFCLYTSEKQVIDKVLTLQTGDEVYIAIDYLLLTDNSFNNYLYPYITGIKKVVHNEVE